MLLAMVVMWAVCAVLTFAGVLPDDSNVYGHAARVDLKVETLHSTPWLSLPYPGNVRTSNYWKQNTIGNKAFVKLLEFLSMWWINNICIAEAQMYV